MQVQAKFKTDILIWPDFLQVQLFHFSLTSDPVPKWDYSGKGQFIMLVIKQQTANQTDGMV
jgi:hypothetical protein